MRAIITKSDQHRGIRPRVPRCRMDIARVAGSYRRGSDLLYGCTQFLHKSAWIAGGVLRITKRCWVDDPQLAKIRKIVETHEDELINAWNVHFES